MKKTNYFFQKKSFVKRFFETGLTCKSAILLHLSETRRIFVENMPHHTILIPIKWLLEEPDSKNHKQTFGREIIKRNLRQLEQQGLVFQDKVKKSYNLTPEGKKLIAYTKDYYSTLKKSWDKKFRIVIFDIPEQKRTWRRILRRELSLMQYVQLQKSVYIGKHPLPKSFLQEIEEAEVGEHILIFTVDQIERKEHILKLLDS